MIGSTKEEIIKAAEYLKTSRPTAGYYLILKIYENFLINSKFNVLL